MLCMGPPPPFHMSRLLVQLWGQLKGLTITAGTLAGQKQTSILVTHCATSTRAPVAAPVS